MKTQSSKALNKELAQWYQEILSGQIKLPRFQRYEAWDKGRIISFLNTVINNLPIGVALILDVAGTEKFVSRFISTAEPQSLGATVNQHLLDGQQRLTAFWRAMHNNYKHEKYFIYFPEFDEYESNKGESIEVYCESRWLNKNGLTMPLWADNPCESFKRGLVPVELLRPTDMAKEVESWIQDATEYLAPPNIPTDIKSLDHVEALELISSFQTKSELFNKTKERLKDQINQLREIVRHYNLPYLALPSDTPKEVALQVFINMNTNSKPLSLYDIIVAEIENVTGKSLHDHEAELQLKAPKAIRYGNLRHLILATSALLQDKVPNNRGMIEMDKSQILALWPSLTRGVDKMTDLLGRLGVIDEARLPTNAILAVVSALYKLIQDDETDKIAIKEKVLKAYIWRSFFTNRYENSAASRAYADFKEIKILLTRLDKEADSKDLVNIPIFNEKEYPLADLDVLKMAGWPKNVGIQARGTLTISNYFGAHDFADNHNISYQNVSSREYHHLFPDALLKEAGIKSFEAMNCALITWKTNRSLGRQDPLVYIKERTKLTTIENVSMRFKSHLIPFDLLKDATYEGLSGEALEQVLKNDYEQFKNERAKLFKVAIGYLCNGDDPSLDNIWNEYSLLNEKSDYIQVE